MLIHDLTFGREKNECGLNTVWGVYSLLNLMLFPSVFFSIILDFFKYFLGHFGGFCRAFYLHYPSVLSNFSCAEVWYSTCTKILVAKRPRSTKYTTCNGDILLPICSSLIWDALIQGQNVLISHIWGFLKQSLRLIGEVKIKH